MAAYGPPRWAYDFLPSRVQAFTIGRYEGASAELNEWLGPDERLFWSLGEEEQDFMLSDFIMELRDREDKALQAGATVVASAVDRFHEEILSHHQRGLRVVIFISSHIL